MFKGALCSLEVEVQCQKFNIYNINEAITQTEKYLYFPLLNKQAVLFFIQFIQS